MKPQKMRNQAGRNSMAAIITNQYEFMAQIAALISDSQNIAGL
jgi:hypothetical protein